jgi:hypothetical protein
LEVESPGLGGSFSLERRSRFSCCSIFQDRIALVEVAAGLYPARGAVGTETRAFEDPDVAGTEGPGTSRSLRGVHWPEALLGGVIGVRYLNISNR